MKQQWLSLLFRKNWQFFFPLSFFFLRVFRNVRKKIILQIWSKTYFLVQICWIFFNSDYLQEERKLSERIVPENSGKNWLIVFAYVSKYLASFATNEKAGHFWREWGFRGKGDLGGGEIWGRWEGEGVCKSLPGTGIMPRGVSRFKFPSLQKERISSLIICRVPFGRTWRKHQKENIKKT